MELRASFAWYMENKRSKAAYPAIILNYFIKYQAIIDEHHIPLERIWNVDEKGFIKGYAGAHYKIIIPEEQRKNKFTMYDGS